MKVMVDKIVVSQVEYDLPEKCPDCECDFTTDKKQVLVELQLVSGQQDCFLTVGSGVIKYGEYDYDDQETVYVQGYKCGACGMILILEEEYCVRGTEELKEVSTEEFKEHLEQAALSDSDPNKRD